MKRPAFLTDEHLAYLDELEQRGTPQEQLVFLLFIAFETMSWKQAQDAVVYWLTTLG